METKRIEVTPLQEKILFSDKSKTVLSCGRGTGKTAITSIIAILAMLKGEETMIVAPTYRMIRKQNMKQITEFLYEYGIKADINKSDYWIKSEETGGQIHLLSGEAPEKIRGYTKISTIIFDEAALLDEACWKNSIPISRDLKGKKRKIYIVSTPPNSERHWMVKAARQTNTAFFAGDARENYFVEADYLSDMEEEYKDYPEDYTRRELYGELVFPDDSSKLFGQFEIIEEEWKDNGEPIVLGLDISGLGRDLTCGALAQGNHLIAIETAKTPKQEDWNDFASKMIDLSVRLTGKKPEAMRFDGTSLISSVQFDIDESVKQEPVNFGGSGGQRFEKKRGQMYFQTASKKSLKIVPGNKHKGPLLEELKATDYKYGESRKIQMMQKDEIKKAFGRSPDRADAVVLSQTYVRSDARSEINQQELARIQAAANPWINNK